MKKRLFVFNAIVFVIFITLSISSVLAASQGANSPGTMADNASVGTVTWSNPDNAKVSDTSYATASVGADNTPKDRNVKIIKSDGSIGTTNKALADFWSKTEGYYSYGSSSDLWGEVWRAEDINDLDFGVVISVFADSDSHYLKATNFGFSIPLGATINGILVEIQRKNTGILAGGVANVNHIRITVYYTNETATVDSCKTLTMANTAYTLDRNLDSSGTCITIGANNITLDGAGYTINFSQGAGSGFYGVNSTRFNNTIIKNLRIIQGNLSTVSDIGIFARNMHNGSIANNTIITGTASSNYGIRVESQGAIVNVTSNIISNNNITTQGINARGIFISQAGTITIFNNTIRTLARATYSIETSSSFYTNISDNTIYGTTPDSTDNGIGVSITYFNVISNNHIIVNGTGIRLGGAYNLVSNNNVTTTTINSHGISIESGKHSIFTNNTLFTIDTGSSGYSLTSDTQNNTMSGGSINSLLSPSYQVSQANPTNRFINTNVSSALFGVQFQTANDSHFVYNDKPTGDVFVDTNVSKSFTLMNRSVITWISTNLNWTDSFKPNVGTNVNVSYNISGLTPSTNYTIKNGSTSRILSSDSAGNILITLNFQAGVLTPLSVIIEACNPTLNADWLITYEQVCDGVQVTTGTGSIIVSSGGSLILINVANVTTNGFNITRTGDAVFVMGRSELRIT